jgi:hypothetical protein
MTIKNVIDFYFNQYETINLCVEMFSGIKGKYHTIAKSEAYDFLAGFLDESVIAVTFQTHYYNKTANYIKECDNPILHILCKSC